jgi:hypothetical protein
VEEVRTDINWGLPVALGQQTVYPKSRKLNLELKIINKKGTADRLLIDPTELIVSIAVTLLNVRTQ